ncbi:MAG: putative toxin-antitoxin system toxin component, PIN family [Lentisphaerae bacterium]|nr:putative toxin-antitoxin system toxin component, PIN family [Lentisphaerota bacterium]
MRVFLDTNVIASATATRGLCADVLRTTVEFHELVVSEEAFTELKRILKIKLGAPDDLIKDTIWLLHQGTHVASSRPRASLPLKDVADIAIVSAAINGAADQLVTGDKELLALGRVGPLDILNPRQFWEKLRGQSAPRD